MVHQRLRREDAIRLLAAVRYGMPVYDRNGSNIGTVNDFRFPQKMYYGKYLIEDARVLHAPEDVQVRLLTFGYIRIKSRWKRQIYYAPANEIEEVYRGRVVLSVAADQLQTLLANPSMASPGHRSPAAT